MPTKRAATLMSSALIYAQGLLVVTAVTAVVMRLPADEHRSASTAQPVVASIITDTVAQ